MNTASAAAKSPQSCPALCDPIDGSPPGFTVPGILQARTLEWVAISFSSAWKWKVKVKSLSRVRLLVAPWTAAFQAPPSMGFSRQEYWSGVPLPSPVSLAYQSLYYCGLGRHWWPYYLPVLSWFFWSTNWGVSCKVAMWQKEIPYPSCMALYKHEGSLLTLVPFIPQQNHQHWVPSIPAQAQRPCPWLSLLPPPL